MQWELIWHCLEFRNAVSQVHVIGGGSWSDSMMLQSSLRMCAACGAVKDNGAIFPPTDVGNILCGVYLLTKCGVLQQFGPFSEAGATRMQGRNFSV